MMQWPDSTLKSLQTEILSFRRNLEYFCDSVKCVRYLTLLYKFQQKKTGFFKNVLPNHRRFVIQLAAEYAATIKDRAHFLTQDSAETGIWFQIVVLGSEKLENMFFDDFEQNEKMGFLNFFNDEIFFYRKKLWVRR